MEGVLREEVDINVNSLVSASTRIQHLSPWKIVGSAFDGPGNRDSVIAPASALVKFRSPFAALMRPNSDDTKAIRQPWLTA